MKDQITTLMEAFRLVEMALDKFKRGRKSRDATLDTVERILDDPKVAGAVRTMEHIVGPPLVPDDEP